MAGLYVHIPFCIKKCDYCDFVSFSSDEVPDEYVDALLKEIGMVSALPDRPRTFDSIFFGGGTPSLLSGGQLAVIMDALQNQFDVSRDAEVSLECNPGTASAEKLRAYHNAGVNRLSIGMQSSKDHLLAAIGRIHNHAQFLHTVSLARDAGFFNINADIMCGLPGQSQDDYLLALNAACELDVSHISAYSLILEEDTPLYAQVRRGERQLPDADAVADMQDAGLVLLYERGFDRYEISNFSKPGYACRHNLNYWQNGEYLGFGLAAHSVLRAGDWTRWANVEALKDYYRLLQRGKRPCAEILRLLPADEMFESVMLGLRLVAGIDRLRFFERFGISMKDAYPRALKELDARGWLMESETHIALTPRGLDMQNAALQLFM